MEHILNALSWLDGVGLLFISGMVTGIVFRLMFPTSSNNAQVAITPRQAALHVALMNDELSLEEYKRLTLEEEEKLYGGHDKTKSS